jgi:hypothetical protein
VRKAAAQKVEELHAILPDDFKDFVRRVAAVPKATIQADDSVKPDVKQRRVKKRAK